MVKLLEMTANRFRMRDTDGSTVFDTQERLFTLTNRLTGSVTRGPWVASNTNVNDSPAGGLRANNLVFLGSCHSAADTVRGIVRVATIGGTQGNLTNIGAFNVSGTYMHYLDAINFPTATRNIIRQIVTFTFKATGGSVFLHENLFVGAEIQVTSPPTQTITVLQTQLSYDLIVGTWT